MNTENAKPYFSSRMDRSPSNVMHKNMYIEQSILFRNGTLVVRLSYLCPYLVADPGHVCKRQPPNDGLGQFADTCTTLNELNWMKSM